MAQPARIAETHVSTLVFVGDRVYKAKKAIQTGFLDFTDRAARRAACEREVELNRRLAPDIYLGVADLTMDDQVIDHLVVMRRMPDEHRLSSRLDRDTIHDDLRDVAHLLATFHARAVRGPEIDDAARHPALTQLWETAFEQVGAYVGPVLDEESNDRLMMLTREYLAGRTPLVSRRVESGRACDGHGDLQAEDIFVLDDGPRILDCLEFDDRLRYGDVLSDVAFLAMDLERLDHPDMGRGFLGLYRELSGDTWPESLAHLHIAYRAHVRSKVNCIRHEQGDEPARQAARDLHRIALDHLEAGRVQLVLVGGSPGTGKSTIANAIADSLGAAVLSSDELRDDLIPRSGGPEGSMHEGRYRPELVVAVYRGLIERAEATLGQGVSVVLDASWLDPTQRGAARALATATSSHLVELRCVCPEDVAAERVRRRAAQGPTSSEATPSVARALARDAPPWPEAIEVGTDQPVDSAIATALAAVNDSVAHR